jgi:YgiT-type zinc finger domain-containing protein
MQKTHICHVCGTKMYQKTESIKYQFRELSVTVDDVHVFRCHNCGEEILEAEEVKRIEDVFIAKIGE